MARLSAGPDRKKNPGIECQGLEKLGTFMKRTPVQCSAIVTPV
jgi:hypothetical protein